MESQMASRDVARAAVLMSLSRSRDEEHALRVALKSDDNIIACAVDVGGEYITSIAKFVERAIVAAKREGLITPDIHHEEGAIAGAAREALAQVMQKALGLNVGGKIGLTRKQNHVAVAIFLGIGLLHLNEVAIGLGHRAV